jgi:DNA-binding transcriptional regulator YiaG
MSKIVTKGQRRLVGDRWHDDNGPLPDIPTEWDPPMTDDEILAAARSDPDAQPLNERKLAGMRRLGLAGVIRRRLGLTHAEFEARYHVPAATLRGWERGTEPDAAMQAFLALVDADPDGAAEIIARRAPIAAK